MQRFGTLTDAIRLAEFAHGNQFDKAGLPYIDHPKRVLAKVQAQGALPYVQIAAILHDVTEDTPFTPEMLIDLGFSEAAVRLIELLDRDASEARFNSPLWEGILAGRMTKDEFYYDQITSDKGAKMIKLADIEDNLSPWRLSYLSPKTQHKLHRKYHYAKLVLDGYDQDFIENAMKNWDEMNPPVDRS